MLKTSRAAAVCAITAAKSRLECFRAEWYPVRVKKTHQNKGLGPARAGLSPDRQTRYELAFYCPQSRHYRVWRKSMAAKTKFRGSFTALVTPFKNGSLDEAAFRGLVSWQIEQGSHGLVPVGTTGESPTLSHEEHHRVVEMCIDESKGRVPVIAGAGSNSTREA